MLDASAGTADPIGSMNPMAPRVARVLRRRREAPEVWTLEIEAEETPGQTFTPGQFNMLTVFGVGEVAISLSGDPANSGRLVHTIRAAGPVSTALARLRAGDKVGLRGPFGRGWPMAEMAGRDVVIVAGGLGLAPLCPVLSRLLAERERYGKIVLLYGARGPHDILLRREMAAWRRHGVDVEVTVDHAVDDWQGQVGVVTALIPGAAFDPLRTISLVCGPEVMMRFSIAALRDEGLAADAIYLSLERNMKCAVGFCGHCQFGPMFVCRDGPVFRYDRVSSLLGLKEI